MILFLVVVGLWAAFSGDPDNPSAIRGFILLAVIAILFLAAVGQLLAAL